MDIDPYSRAIKPKHHYLLDGKPSAKFLVKSYDFIDVKSNKKVVKFMELWNS